jgi:hypothetical protein
MAKVPESDAHPMSMNARYVEVTAEELSELQANPGSIADLFDAEPELGALDLTDDARQRIEHDGPVMLSQALGSLDPAVRDSLAEQLESLGLDPATLADGVGGLRLLELMEERARAGRGENGHRTLSLDKAWHGVHYLLCGELEPRPGARGSVVLGGTELGEDDFGYGAARCFSAQEVTEIAAELARPDVEQELIDRYEPAQLTARGVYPFGWEAEDGEWLFEGYRDLRDFFRGAAGRGNAVLTCLV